MEKVWESPGATFWRRLLNQNVDKFLNDPEKRMLRHLRYDHNLAKEYERYFGAILKERGLDLDMLIGEAHGENWDLGECAFVPKETREKVACNHQRNPGNHDDLDRAREIGIFEGQGQRDVLQSCFESGGQDLEEKGQGVKEV